MNFDAFISHAWEDKDDFVTELAQKLQEHRVEVWYDEFSLKVGDSLRQSIDFGLSKSRFGIVVLSKNFFQKRWTNWELDGLVQRQNNSSNTLIIPIWHNISKQDILEYSPSLADKVAIRSDIGISNIVKQIDEIINPRGSTLIVARDYLISQNHNPPVLTDDWWLDVLEYCGSTFPQTNYLNFHVPWMGYEPRERGKYIGMNALQMLWQENAQNDNISQLSNPIEILNFIDNQPGLRDKCLEQPEKTALFFPQLTIKGLGGFMEISFAELHKIKDGNDRYSCIQEIALRDKEFGRYNNSTIASFYFTGDGGGIGPSTRLYDLIDCLIWLLSEKSNWLPENIRTILLKGLCDWGAWTWDNIISYEGYEKNEDTGEFTLFLHDLFDNPQLEINGSALRDLAARINITIEILALPESKEELVKKFLDMRIIESWISSKFNWRRISTGN
jgi:hypothetical protein